MTSLVPDPAPIEVGFERMFDSYGRYKAAIADIPKIGRTQWPEAWIDPLIEHSGLQPIARFLDFHGQPKASFTEGLNWQAVRGTARAYIQSAGWTGVPVTVEKGWANHIPDRVSLHLGTLVYGQSLDDLIDLGRLSKSDSSFFFRMTFGLDVRPLRSGYSKAGKAIYSGFSGVLRQSDEPILSFRVRVADRVELDHGVSRSSVSLGVSGHAKRVYPIRYGRDKLPAKSAQPYRFSASLSIPIRHEAGARNIGFTRRATPRFAVVGGRARFGRSIYHGSTLRPGKAKRLPFHQRYSDWYPSYYEALAELPLPNFVNVSASLNSISWADSSIQLAIQGGSGTVDQKSDLVLQLTGSTRLEVNAPFSTFPFIDAPWGEGQPRTVVTITQELI